MLYMLQAYAIEMGVYACFDFLLFLPEFAFVLYLVLLTSPKADFVWE